MSEQWTHEPDEVAGDEVEATPDATAEADEPQTDEVTSEDQSSEDQSSEDQSSEESDEEEADPVEEFRQTLAGKPGDWYVVHSYAGYENRVKHNLETRIQSLNMEDYIFEVQVPTEEVTEIKGGQRKLVKRVRMPGYVLVRMILTDESWGAVRHTPGVTGFVGNAHQPVPLSLDEVVSMLAPALEKPSPRWSSRSASPSPSWRVRSRPCPPRSPRSSPSPRSSRCWSRSSAGRRRSSCRSTRSPRSEDAPPGDHLGGHCNRVIAHGVGPPTE